MRVLDLFCGLKGWSAPFVDAGHDVVTLDWEASFDPDIAADVLSITPADLLAVLSAKTGDPAARFDLVLASPPCEKFSVAALSRNWWAVEACRACGADVKLTKRHHGRGSAPDEWDHLEPAECPLPGARLSATPRIVPKSKDALVAQQLVEQTLTLIEALSPAAFIVENPRAMMRRLPQLDHLERRTVSYCRYGETFRKPTDLWGGFPPTLHLHPVCDTDYRPQQTVTQDGMVFVIDKTTQLPCHEAAPRGAKTGVQGLANAAERGRIPYALAASVMVAMYQWGVR